MKIRDKVKITVDILQDGLLPAEETIGKVGEIVEQLDRNRFIVNFDNQPYNFVLYENELKVIDEHDEFLREMMEINKETYKEK